MIDIWEARFCEEQREDNDTAAVCTGALFGVLPCADCDII